jgi:hypothetical protein
MNKTLTKVLAGSAAAALLVPTLAMAHEGGLKLRVSGAASSTPGGIVHVAPNATADLHASVNAAFHRDDNQNDNHGKHKSKQNRGHTGEHKVASSTMNATTTASIVTKIAQRLNSVADFFASLRGPIVARIASSTTGTTTANAELAEFDANIAGAHLEANSAINLAGQVNASTSASTSNALLDDARENLGDARDFLKAARENLMNIFRALGDLSVSIQAALH